MRDAQLGQERFVLPQELHDFIVNSGPEVMDQLGDILGDGTELPESMVEINNILNQLPADSREMLLGEYVNRLYNPEPNPPEQEPAA